MSDEIHTVKETTTELGDTVERTTEVRNNQASTEHNRDVVERVIWFIVGTLMTLLGLRFVLSLLGANTANQFADFIYSLSRPFVAPFFSLFSYDGYVYGQSRFEVYTLVAMLVYSLLGWGITKLVTLNKR